MCRFIDPNLSAEATNYSTSQVKSSQVKLTTSNHDRIPVCSSIRKVSQDTLHHTMIQQEPYDDTTRVLPELRESETSYVLCSIIQTDDLLKLDSSIYIR